MKSISSESLPLGWPLQGDEAGVRNADEAGEAELQFSPGPVYDERLQGVLGAQARKANAVLEAASVLLRSLAEIPRRLDRAGLDGLHELLTQELRVFTRLCEQANLRRDHMLVTRYALCTALDESISLSPAAGGAGDSTGSWSTRALLNTFHGESQGGRKVFLIIGRLAASVDEHLDVLELLSLLLGLGFMGDYRVQADGRRHLETIRQRLHGLISARRPAVTRELSLRTQRADTGRRFRLLRSVPVWVSATLIGLAVFSLFAWQKYQLLLEGEQLQARIAALQKIPLAAPPAATQRLTLAALLADEIKSQRVSVVDEDQRSQVVFKGDGMFSGGLTQLAPDTVKMLQRIGRALNEVPGTVRVIGHTDNVPVQAAEFPSNQALSEARARAVIAVLAQAGVAADRLQALGMGERQPLESNAAAAGRARNRRVEIEVKLGTEASSAPATGIASTLNATGPAARASGAKP